MCPPLKVTIILTLVVFCPYISLSYHLCISVPITALANFLLICLLRFFNLHIPPFFGYIFFITYLLRNLYLWACRFSHILHFSLIVDSRHGLTCLCLLHLFILADGLRGFSDLGGYLCKYRWFCSFSLENI